MNLDAMTMIVPAEGETMAKQLLKLPVKGRMLELGTGFGHSSCYFASVKPNWFIYTVDAYGLYGTGRNLFNYDGNKLQEQGMQKVLSFIKDNGTRKIIPIVGNTNDLGWELPINALFIDADHSYEWVKKDTENYMDFVTKGGLIMYHDYNDNWDVKTYFDKEMVGRKGWKTWSENGIAFAEKI